MARPRFTIVSPAMNSLAYLPRNLASVRSQGLAPGELEHWIIDGGSHDGSVEYLRAQPDVHFVSERDRGLSHAVNKGLERARGEWIIWLNSDDELAPGALARFQDRVRDADCIVCGTQEVRGYDGEFIERTEPWDVSADGLLNRRTDIIQASTFVHREVYGRVGGMDGTFRFAMDYEWMVRALHEFELRRIDDLLTVYHRRRGSITDVGIAGQHREFLRVRRQHSCNPLHPMELRLWGYLATEPLRRISVLRNAVRGVKRALFRT